jgi:hypothetical protein
MANHVPRHALTLMANSANLAAKHGLKKGLSKAASKTNPALLVIEAAVSVAEAVNSYLQLRKAREHRDGLQRLIPHEEERLRLERQHLEEQLDLAKKEIAQNKDIQRRLGELVLACGRACRTTWTELHAIRASDLPDLENFDTQLRTLEGAWSDLQHALQNFNETSV